ncbi:hypothetical protein TcasGA2_TC008906 [Tribolium castaneum]|uniref:Uncharacterized protein n=1 Tax=Tribolium castaneum TaxID=7070 RepID=D6WQI0_TRICA|nr:hypothetical protein TcasGA2_TC008906 [Tribolium castaneum]
MQFVKESTRKCRPCFLKNDRRHRISSILQVSGVGVGVAEGGRRRRGGRVRRHPAPARRWQHPERQRRMGRQSEAAPEEISSVGRVRIAPRPVSCNNRRSNRAKTAISWTYLRRGWRHRVKASDRWDLTLCWNLNYLRRPYHFLYPFPIRYAGKLQRSILYFLSHERKSLFCAPHKIHPDLGNRINKGNVSLRLKIDFGAGALTFVIAAAALHISKHQAFAVVTIPPPRRTDVILLQGVAALPPPGLLNLPYLTRPIDFPSIWLSTLSNSTRHHRFNRAFNANDKQ